MMCRLAEHFAALSTTISSIYDLRGIGVSAVYICNDLWEWMRDQECKRLDTSRSVVTGCRLVYPNQDYEESGAEFHITKSGTVAATMKPYGADHKIPVKVKYSGRAPWKIVAQYRQEA